MKCPNCGAEVSADQIICEECYINIVEAQELKIQSVTRIFAANTGTKEEVEKIKHETQIAVAKAELDKTIRDALNNAAIENAEVNTKVVKEGAEAKVHASNAFKTEKLNELSIEETENEIAHKEKIRELEIIAKKREVGI